MRTSTLRLASFVLLVFIAAVTSVALERNREAPGIWPATQQTTDFDFAGMYVMSDDKRRWWPRGFENLSDIYLEGNTNLARGSVHTNPRNTEFKFTAISVSREKITFTTRSIQGISYKFAGKFLVDDPVVAPEAPAAVLEREVLEGTLVKLQGGKQVASAKVRLRYFPGGD